MLERTHQAENYATRVAHSLYGRNAVRMAPNAHGPRILGAHDRGRADLRQLQKSRGQRTAAENLVSFRLASSSSTVCPCRLLVHLPKQGQCSFTDLTLSILQIAALGPDRMLHQQSNFHKSRMAS